MKSISNSFVWMLMFYQLRSFHIQVGKHLKAANKCWTAVVVSFWLVFDWFLKFVWLTFLMVAGQKIDSWDEIIEIVRGH